MACPICKEKYVCDQAKHNIYYAESIEGLIAALEKLVNVVEKQTDLIDTLRKAI